MEIGISIHAPREGGDRCRRGLSPAGTISIHAPREGGDLLVSCSPHGSCDFNPRPPRGGRRRITQEAGRPKLFQSTPPARGATSSLSKGYLPATGFQSTPPARGATSVDAILPIYYQYFNPRPPRGGRHRVPAFSIADIRISIHAPREGGDCVYRNLAPLTPDFNPRPPRGGRPHPVPWMPWPADFNPRPPRGGRPCHCPLHGGVPGISIHAPREGGDITARPSGPAIM